MHSTRWLLAVVVGGTLATSVQSRLAVTALLSRPTLTNGYAPTVSENAVTPTHRDGRAAASRVQNMVLDGQEPMVTDSLVMLCYHLSLELRRVPERERMAAALQISRRIVANTRESLE